ncbi:hypothetical protein ACFQ69_34645 [Streptomyces sp. NPDC056470]|uniref:hypothetical protein n=1 Tax=Streptomyces sp. NPDC056470 TaxID=3345831 RepID=UPI0036CF9CAD
MNMFGASRLSRLIGTASAGVAIVAAAVFAGAPAHAGTLGYYNTPIGQMITGELWFTNVSTGNPYQQYNQLAGWNTRTSYWDETRRLWILVSESVHTVCLEDGQTRKLDEGYVSGLTMRQIYATGWSYWYKDCDEYHG